MLRLFSYDLKFLANTWKHKVTRDVQIVNSIGIDIIHLALTILENFLDVNSPKISLRIGVRLSMSKSKKTPLSNRVTLSC